MIIANVHWNKPMIKQAIVNNEDVPQATPLRKMD